MGQSFKLGVLSDTHIPTRARLLPDKLVEVFRDTDFIIHAGDYVNSSVIEELQKYAPVVGCYGNMDPTTLKNQLPKIAILKVENTVIKIIHNLSGGAKVKQIKKAGKVDVIIHGHTHKRSVEKADLLILNPGSATNSFYTANSVGLLYITADHVDYELIELK